jgi:hypothetical protein
MGVGGHVENATLDLRTRVLAASGGGLSCRAVRGERAIAPGLIANALAPNHPFAEPIGVASNYQAAIFVVILLDDAATATFISIIVASIIVDPWTSRTKFDSDLSVSGRPGGGRDRADYSGEDRQHQQSSHGTVSMSVNTINAIRLE